MKLKELCLLNPSLDLHENENDSVKESLMSSSQRKAIKERKNNSKKSAPVSIWFRWMNWLSQMNWLGDSRTLRSTKKWILKHRRILITSVVIAILAIILSIFFSRRNIIPKKTIPDPAKESIRRMQDAIVLKLPPEIIPDLFNISESSMTEINWNNTDPEFLNRVLEYNVPVLIRNAPVRQWPIFQSNWDLLKISKRLSHEENITLEGTRWQLNEPTFLLGYEREVGGMLGSKHDRPLTYLNVTLKQFLSSTLKKDSYLYWTGKLSVWENLVKQGSATGSEDGWSKLRVVDRGLENSINKDDLSLWTPMLWISHPGVVAQTHYDTQHNFFLQIFGTKKFVIFSPDTEMYTFPNIHRSYRQSQAILSGGRPEDIVNKFPRISQALGLKVTMKEGDLLYIPPYWYHRVESHTLGVSLSVLSPSLIEAALSEAYWLSVPFGKFVNSTKSRTTAASLYLELVLNETKSLSSNLIQFSRKLYESRFRDLYPPSELQHLYSTIPNYLTICDKYSVNDDQEGDEDSVYILDKLTESMLLFEKASHAVGSIVDSLHEINGSIGIKETFMKDYIEQIIRWAVGPVNTPLYIFKCLGRY